MKSKVFMANEDADRYSASIQSLSGASLIMGM